jgi:hypothetical protein
MIEAATDSNTLPFSIAAQPVYSRLGSDAKDVVAYIYTAVLWDIYLRNLIPEGVKGIVVVLRNSCGQEYTYELTADQPIFRGEGNVQDSKYAGSKRPISVANNYVDPERAQTVLGHCQFFLDAYSSAAFEEDYQSALPVIFTLIIALLFIIMAAIFVVYDRLVQSRNDKVVGAAARSNAIVSSLFPSNVRARLLAEQEEEANQKTSKIQTLRGFLTGEVKQDDELENHVFKTKPIADLFLDTTVSHLVCDVVTPFP